MAKSHLQGHQEALLNFGPSTYVSYNSWRSNLTYLFYAWGSKVFFSSINQTINQLYLNTVFKMALQAAFQTCRGIITIYKN